MLDIGFRRLKKHLDPPAREEDAANLLRDFDPSVPFVVASPSRLEQAKSFFSSPSKSLLVIVALSGLFLGCLLIPLIVSIVNSEPRTLKNGTFILATFHSVLGVVVLENASVSSLLQVGDEPRGLLVLPDGGLLFTQSRTSNSRVWKLKNACSGRDAQVFSHEAVALSHPYGLAANAHSGIVYVTNQLGNSIVVLNSTSGDMVNDAGIVFNLGKFFFAG
jgi:DNA-binding beta-propeller fold protein YncE